MWVLQIIRLSIFRGFGSVGGFISKSDPEAIEDPFRRGEGFAPEPKASVGSESRPPMLNKENYVPWSSRLLWYAKSRPNGKLIHNSILNGPYVRRMTLEPGDANRDVNVTLTVTLTCLKPFMNKQMMSEKEIKQIEADDQATDFISGQACYVVLQSWVSKKFMTECVVLFPIAVTFFVTWWIVQFLNGFFSPIYERLGVEIFDGCYCFLGRGVVHKEDAFCKTHLLGI
nr:protein like COV 2 [Tanacetum cinerariifolium]